MYSFRDAVEARDVDGALECLDEDVEFRSPIAHTPYFGRAAVAPILRAVAEVFEDFRYVRELGPSAAGHHALVYEARVGDKLVEGCDFLRYDASGAIQELFVMVRPLSAALAVAHAMQARLQQNEPTHGG